MTFKQKNITVTLANFSLILAFYLFRLFQIVQSGNFIGEKIFWLWGILIVMALVVTIAATVLTHVVLAVIQAIQTGDKKPEIDETKDERDDIIDLKGTQVNHFVSSLGVFIAMLTYAFGQPPLIMFSLIIFFAVLAQIAGDSRRLLLYQKGF